MAKGVPGRIELDDVGAVLVRDVKVAGRSPTNCLGIEAAIALRTVWIKGAGQSDVRLAVGRGQERRADEARGENPTSDARALELDGVPAANIPGRSVFRPAIGQDVIQVAGARILDRRQAAEPVSRSVGVERIHKTGPVGRRTGQGSDAQEFDVGVGSAGARRWENKRQPQSQQQQPHAANPFPVPLRHLALLSMKGGVPTVAAIGTPGSRLMETGRNGVRREGRMFSRAGRRP